MRRQRRRDTAPELAVRQRLHAADIRYRIDTRLESGLRARGDIVWRGLQLVVFIDGCYWHGCPVHATSPKANAEWWRAKLDANVDRDRRTDKVLHECGWTVLRFWEHENPVDVVNSITRELDARKVLAGRRGRISRTGGVGR